MRAAHGRLGGVCEFTHACNFTGGWEETMAWQYVMIGLGKARSEGKNLLCAQRGEEWPHLLHLENAGICTEMQVPARNTCWFRGVFDMNKVILKLDWQKNKRWKKRLHHLLSPREFLSSSNYKLEAQKCRTEMDCRTPSSLTTPHRDENKFNSHGKKIKSG